MGGITIRGSENLAQETVNKSPVTFGRDLQRLQSGSPDAGPLVVTFTFNEESQTMTSDTEYAVVTAALEAKRSVEFHLITGRGDSGFRQFYLDEYARDQEGPMTVQGYIALVSAPQITSSRVRMSTITWTDDNISTGQKAYPGQ